MRLSTNQTYRLVLDGIQMNLNDMVRYSEQASSGRRLIRPSDDPAATALALGLERRVASINRSVEAANSGRDVVDGAAGVLQEVSGLVSQVRSLVIQGMNGTLDPQSRKALADEVSLLREQLVTLGNTRQGNRYLFAGSKSDERPFTADASGSIGYGGDDIEQDVRIGDGVGIPINVTGASLFMRSEGSGPTFSGLTGLASGSTASEGNGDEQVVVRHDATDLSAIGASGVVSAGSGAADTFVGSATLTIDATAGTVTLGDGEPVSIPDPSQPGYAELVVKNAAGGELRLDMTAWNGADAAGTVAGDASISIDGSNFEAIDFADPQMRLENPSTGAVLNVDVSGLQRAGEELVQFSGDISIFDVLDGISADLASSENFESSDFTERLGMRLGELDRHQNNVLAGLGVLGSRSARLGDTATRLETIEIRVQEQLSNTRDADLTETVLDLQRSEQLLQLSQSVGSRLIQTSLLNFL